MYSKSAVLGLLSLMICAVSSAQSLITGKIIQAVDSLPLGNATVQIPEIPIVAVTDKDGVFTIPGVPHGKFTMQFSFVGFETNVQTIEVRDSLVRLTILMNPSSSDQNEVVITGFTTLPSELSPYSIAILNKDEISTTGSVTVNEALSRQPGISQITTGPGIGKPVVRGLYGNRLQVVQQGIRFENQQWQDEHNLGLTETGIDRIEVIKGPASLLYGPEALGGVIHVIEEDQAPAGTMTGDYRLRMFSNTHGILTEAGIKNSGPAFSWKIRAGAESHADYTDGNNDRVLNTRFNSFHVKGGANWKKNNFTSNNTYQFSHDGAGFILIDTLEHLEPDERYSRKLSLPHHLVDFHLLTSENCWYRNKSKLQLNAGAHLNHRQEQEAGNKISIDMQFNSFNLDLKWNRDISTATRLIIGGTGSYQSNTNFGSRIIIPDATVGEGGLFGCVNHQFKKIFLQAGIRYDIRDITTVETDLLNSLSNPNPFDEILPFHKTFQAFNAAAGSSISILKHFLFKLNLATGYRTPNLAELSSNGLHEGTFRYEVGDIGLKTEQNLGIDGTLEYSSGWMNAALSVFYNDMNNYVYLQNTGTQYIGFYVYEYTQTDAALTGGEFSMNLHPGFISWLTYRGTVSLTEGKKDDGEFLPFIPPVRITNEIRLSFEKLAFFKRAFVKGEIVNVSEQNKTGPFETPSPAYMLLNCGIGSSFSVGSSDWQWSLTANNLLNEVYIDHLSRIKPLGLNNTGININLNIYIPFYLKKQSNNQ
jgi:iron complex outermembrane recepter protein